MSDHEELKRRLAKEALRADRAEFRASEMKAELEAIRKKHAANQSAGASGAEVVLSELKSLVSQAQLEAQVMLGPGSAAAVPVVDLVALFAAPRRSAA